MQGGPSQEDATRQPLKGLLVLDFSTLLPGPLASLLLAEAGARVIKIERPGTGDEMRHFDPLWEGESILFSLLNRGKESLALDLKSEAAQEKLRPLIEKADVVIEQFRPGVMERLGLDYANLSRINPRLIYCSITGFGQSGPKSQIAGHDLNYIAETGLLALSRGPLDAPVVPPALIADIAGGSYPAVMNILLALEARRRSGCGAHLDVSMTDNLFTMMFAAIGRRHVMGELPESGADLLTGGTVRYRLYPTADGRLVAAAPLEDRFWSVFCDVIGLDPSLRDDRQTPAATLNAVGKIIASGSAATWQQKFAQANCCCSVVKDLNEALADPHFKERQEPARELAGKSGGVLPALPLPIDGTFLASDECPLAAPVLGKNSLDDPG